MHPVIQTSTIILWTELFPKKRREKIQGEILQSIFQLQNPRVFPVILQELQDFFEYSVFYSVSTRNPATPRYSTYRINSIYRINSSPRNTTTTRLIPCRLLPATAPVSPSILHGRIRLPATLQYSRPTQH